MNRETFFDDWSCDGQTMADEWNGSTMGIRQQESRAQSPEAKACSVNVYKQLMHMLTEKEMVGRS